jgi:hypothetical protein
MKMNEKEGFRECYVGVLDDDNYMVSCIDFIIDSESADSNFLVNKNEFINWLLVNKGADIVFSTSIVEKGKLDLAIPMSDDKLSIYKRIHTSNINMDYLDSLMECMSQLESPLKDYVSHPLYFRQVMSEGVVTRLYLSKYKSEVMKEISFDEKYMICEFYDEELTTRKDYHFCKYYREDMVDGLLGIKSSEGISKLAKEKLFGVKIVKS